MPPSSLPLNPSLDQLRRKAKELRDAAHRGDPAALARLGDLPVRLASAQLALAREHGFASWARLKSEVEARTVTSAERVRAFLEASVGGRPGQAARLLRAHPELATCDPRTAIVLGDTQRVRDWLARDPGAAARPIHPAAPAPFGSWRPLHLVCCSRWHLLDPARAAGLTEVARLLLDHGADPGEMVGAPGVHGHCSPLYGAAGLARNAEIARLLLDRGADPDAHHALYHTAFHEGDHACMRLLLARGARAELAFTLGGAISVGDTEAVRLLLDAGADAAAPIPADSMAHVDPSAPPVPTLCAAVEHDCPASMAELLLERGADPDARQEGGHSPLRMAVRRGRADIAALLRRAGARDDTTPADRFLDACLRASPAEARRMTVDVDVDVDVDVAEDAAVDVAALPPDDLSAVVRAAEHGAAGAVALMLDLGFPLDARGDDGATPLHAAAAAGSVPVVRLLLERGADVEARDTTWRCTPVVWAGVGSGFRMGRDPAPDWVAVTRLLIEAGADLEGAWVPGKPPSAEVGALLRAHGVTPE